MRKKLSFQVLNEQAEDRYPPILIFGMVDVDTILISLEKWKWFFLGKILFILSRIYIPSADSLTRWLPRDLSKKRIGANSIGQFSLFPLKEPRSHTKLPTSETLPPPPLFQETLPSSNPNLRMRTRRSEIGSSANSGNGDTKIQKRTRSESMLESLTKPPQSPVKRTSPRRCSIESQMDDELVSFQSFISLNLFLLSSPFYLHLDD